MSDSNPSRPIDSACSDARPDDESPPESLDACGVGGLSRRNVLAGVLVTGAGVALSPLLQGCASAKHDDVTQAAPATRSAAGAGPAEGMGTVPVTLSINGRSHAMELDPRVTLLDCLRERLNLTGTKKGCDHGQCGACTVLIDGRRVNSCLTLAVTAADKKVTTVEGLANGDELHPVQAAFIECDAFQCGYCTPGQICSAVGAIQEGHLKSDADIREQMSGNICRCGAYSNIVNAVRLAMKSA